MPFQAIAYAMREETDGPLCKLIGIWLANEADDLGIIYPLDLGRLVWFCCTTERRVKTALTHMALQPGSAVMKLTENFQAARIVLPIRGDFDSDGPPPKRRYKPDAEDMEWIAFYSGGHRCAACKSRDELQLDHIWPISKGGWDDRFNMQILCRVCNGAKRAKVGWVPMQ